MMKVAASEHFLQFGGDETGIDRQGTRAQWVMTEDSEGIVEIVTMEAGGFLVGGTAEEAKVSKNPHPVQDQEREADQSDPPQGEEVQCLQELSLLTIKEDRAACIAEDDGEDDEVQNAGFLRALLPISSENSFGTCAKLRSDLDKKVRGKVEAVDDPMLVQCLEQHKGKLLLDEDTQGACEVADVNLTEWAKQKHWPASCVPMELKSGHWVVSESAIAGVGSWLMRSHAR
jgi:hypothetical protein